MKKATLFIILIISLNAFTQNIDYESHIESFYYSGECPDEPFSIEEQTWKGYISDNIDTSETYSGCIIEDVNDAITKVGTYATRTRHNVTTTQIIGRIDAWEDDFGGRCDFDENPLNPNINDECRTQETLAFNLSNPLEYQFTSLTQTIGSTVYNMQLFYQYRYASTTINIATENTTETFVTGGDRPFWGSLGTWSIDNDAATSGTITHNQTSSFSTTVTGKSQVSFEWSVSSEINSDYLQVYVNNILNEEISGNIGWTNKTISLTGNTDTIEWRYTKDTSGNALDDRGHVNNITFTNATLSNIIKENSKISLSMHPNPTSGLVFITYNYGINKITVLDISNRKILETFNNNFNISKLKSGVYFVFIETDQGNVVKRIVRK